MQFLRLGIGAAAGGFLLLAFALILPAFTPPETVDRTLVLDTAAEPEAGGNWLSIHDAKAPAEWLSERASSRGDEAPDAAEFDALLRNIVPFYQETPRMIANRIAQIETATGGDPGAVKLLSDLSWRTDRRRSLGETAQHYLILRRAGLGHAAVIAELRGRSGVLGE